MLIHVRATFFLHSCRSASDRLSMRANKSACHDAKAFSDRGRSDSDHCWSTNFSNGESSLMSIGTLSLDTGEKNTTPAID